MDNYGTWAIAFIDSNKNSLAGFYAAKTLDRYKFEQQLVAYADVIKDKFPGNRDVSNFVKAMEAVKPVSVGHTAPDFSLLDIDGKPVKLSDYKGKYLMLDFWASWCVPCRQENPNVVKQYAEYKDKGLNILGISLDENKGDWAKAVAADKISWRQDGPTEKLFKIEAIPSNYIIDPKGIIIAKNVTGSDLEVFLKKTFNKPQ
jgi:peroxiredoxin